jgi:uncharacterized protein involved in cysteine biosynthesis
MIYVVSVLSLCVCLYLAIGCIAYTIGRLFTTGVADALEKHPIQITLIIHYEEGAE